jgi:YD repeat-containing protein
LRSRPRSTPETLLSLSYSYSQSGNNNGQIAGITDNVESGRTVGYTYDSLHRLKTAVTNGSAPFYPQWGLSWTYDRYGNRTAQTRTYGSVRPGELGHGEHLDQPDHADLP